MAMARSPWLNCGATITLPSINCCIPYRYPAPCRSDQVAANVKSGFDQKSEVASG